MFAPNHSTPTEAEIAAQVAAELQVDIGSGDISSALLPRRQVGASIRSRQVAVVCGIRWAEQAFIQCDANARVRWQVTEGQKVAPHQVWCEIEGDNRALLSAERTALNFLQTLSGTATVVANWVDQVRTTSVTLLDTRKTIPGLRKAQKYAVRVGGGHNHRMGLYDEYLLKENHLSQFASIGEALAVARKRAPKARLVVEVETLAQLSEALQACPDRILLDNFDLDAIAAAVDLARGQVPLEVSGGVSGDSLVRIAQTGIDCISIGALTKHIEAVDLSMRIHW